MTQEELYRYIDELLKLFIDNESINRTNLLIFNKEHPTLKANDLVEAVLTKMEYNFDIINKTGDNLESIWRLTKFGTHVMHHGSWTNYLYNSETLPIRQIESVIATNKSIEKTNQRQFSVLVITVIVAIISQQPELLIL